MGSIRCAHFKNQFAQKTRSVRKTNQRINSLSPLFRASSINLILASVALIHSLICSFSAASSFFCFAIVHVLGTDFTA